MAEVTNGLRTGMFEGYQLPPGRTVADIGGADGSVLVELLTRDHDPDRRGIVFDLPTTIDNSGPTLAAASAPGARLLLVECIVPDGDTPHLTKAVDLTMLGILTGKERTEHEYRTLLDRAGFTLDRIVSTPTPRRGRLDLDGGPGGGGAELGPGSGGGCGARAHHGLQAGQGRGRVQPGGRPPTCSGPPGATGAKDQD